MKAISPVLLLVLLAAAPLEAQQPEWVLGKGVGDSLTALWQRSLEVRAERVACLAGEIREDSVWVTVVSPLAGAASDSLTAGAEESLERCAAPKWNGTIHTHIRSTDHESPAPRFSPGDRAVMSDWVKRWGRPGAFCVLHSDRAMHCEVWPPGPRTAPER